ncbi:uncharacterized protein GGS22DRAFT_109784 [Annulohypoxylon maeteangense]|uniref:uncharacterized protein n=1 Tax=Annulohypoxylon maeteangense TaxID=1927788 RepID=UPI002007CE42|nr:uncharacterized protein GGS22DRAFT_109784 [Annulohypoxylon maeteangense]KAI0887467.1 hypothetical protein GGS22DRAFT_109784 [Annulohypoxylon maeteangense]
MSALTMPSSPYHHGFPHEFSWQESSELSSRPRERIALPSIRQAFPELQLHIQQDIPARTPPSATTPTGRSFNTTTTPPEYVHSQSPQHQKKRPLGVGMDQFEYREDQETNSLPRISTISHDDSRRQLPVTIRRANIEAWEDPHHPSPPRGRPVQSPISREAFERHEGRSNLPSFPMLNLVGSEPRRQVRNEEWMREFMRRPSLSSNGSHHTEGGSPTYRPEGFGYDPHHPSRVQSLSMGSVHNYDRTPFSPGLSPRPYDPQQYHENLMRMRDFSMVMNGEGKQRKRRGNLPKETTDKLRAWFVAHLQHPYPSEEEKHDLMRQTGLQLNQISNWFINARRRQLPTMINNARAESDAMTVRNSDGKLLPSTERADYEPDCKPLSDCDVELESMKRRRINNVNRGSI